MGGNSAQSNQKCGSTVSDLRVRKGSLVM